MFHPNIYTNEFRVVNVVNYLLIVIRVSVKYFTPAISGREDIPIVLYDYQPTRAGEHPKRFLTRFQGYLQVDGYSGYHQIPDVTLVGCWAHARRKFDEALKALPDSQKGKKVKASEGLHFCNQLY